MIRVWCEHLPLEELTRPAALDLLAAEGVHPIVAVRPDTDPALLARVIHAVGARELEVGIWPLLGREEGYWPSERNVTGWSATTLEWLDELEARDARPAWLAVDLEPPLDQTSRLLRRTLDVPVAALEFGRQNLDLARYRIAEREFQALADEVRRRGVRSLGITLPMAAHDLRDGEPLWQDVLETPWSDVGWDLNGIMAYGSIVSGASAGLLSYADARAIHQHLLQRLAAHYRAKSHVSLGVTGVGVFGDEPTWADPEELRLDASAALAAGVTDIGVFCLEGILSRTTPEAWLRAVTHARATAPAPTWKATALRHTARAARALASRFAR